MSRSDPWHRVVIFSDVHGVQRDTVAWPLFLGIVSENPFNQAIGNGDWCDFSQISSHDKSLGSWESDFEDDISLDEELSVVEHEILKPLRKAMGKRPVMLRLGNHETRFLKLSKSNPSAVMELLKTMRKRKSIDLEDLVRLDKYGMTLSYRPADDLYGFTVIHGVKTSQGVAKANLLRYGSGTSGHSHRMSCFTTVMHGKLQGWWESGCLCKTKNISYLPFGDRPDWANGFLTLTINKNTGHFFCKPHFIIDGKCEFNGTIYTA